MGSTGGVYHPRLKLTQHQAAVKALAWCPWQRNVLASGGGTADRTIRIWNTSTGINTKYVDTHSQVCAIQWNETHKEIVSSHGFSDNQLILWSYPSMKRIREFRGHTARVLHMSQSPDHTTVVSASADETLRFWEIFGTSSSSSSSGSSGAGCTTRHSRQSSGSTGGSTGSNGTTTSNPSSAPNSPLPSGTSSPAVTRRSYSNGNGPVSAGNSPVRGLVSPSMTYSLNKGLTSNQATAAFTLR